jgi:ribosome-interacting GTPase 1
LTVNRLIDALSRNRVYIPALFVVNKIDLAKPSEKAKTIYISAENKLGLESLKKAIWQSLNFARIYLVKKGEKPNKKNPLIVKKGQTLEKVAQKLGEEFAKEKTRASIWGKGAKFPAQEVSLNTQIQPGMLVRFI